MRCKNGLSLAKDALDIVILVTDIRESIFQLTTGHKTISAYMAKPTYPSPKLKTGSRAVDMSNRAFPNKHERLFIHGGEGVY